MRCEKNNASVLSFKKLEIQGYQYTLTKIVNLSTFIVTKITTSTGTDITLQTSVKKLRETTMCHTFTSDGRYDYGNIKHFENVFCSITLCSDILCVHTETFQSLKGSGYQCLHRESRCRDRKNPYKKQKNSSFLKCKQNKYIFDETQNQNVRISTKHEIFSITRSPKNVRLPLCFSYSKSLSYRPTDISLNMITS